MKALLNGDNEIFNISTNRTITVNQLYALMKEILKVKYDAGHGEERKGDIKFSCLDNSKAISLLNWIPKYSIEEGLKKTIDYYKQNMVG